MRISCMITAGPRYFGAGRRDCGQNVPAAPSTPPQARTPRRLLANKADQLLKHMSDYISCGAVHIPYRH